MKKMLCLIVFVLFATAAFAQTVPQEIIKFAKAYMPYDGEILSATPDSPAAAKMLDSLLDGQYAKDNSCIVSMWNCGPSLEPIHSGLISIAKDLAKAEIYSSIDGLVRRESGALIATNNLKVGQVGDIVISTIVETLMAGDEEVFRLSYRFKSEGKTYFGTAVWVAVDRPSSTYIRDQLQRLGGNSNVISNKTTVVPAPVPVFEDASTTTGTVEQILSANKRINDFRKMNSSLLGLDE